PPLCAAAEGKLGDLKAGPRNLPRNGPPSDNELLRASLLDRGADLDRDDPVGAIAFPVALLAVRLPVARGINATAADVIGARLGRRPEVFPESPGVGRFRRKQPGRLPARSLTGAHQHLADRRFATPRRAEDAGLRADDQLRALHRLSDL